MQNLAREIKKLESDRKSGAFILTDKVLDIYSDFFKNFDGSDCREMCRSLEELSVKVIHSQAAMASILNISDIILDKTTSFSKSSLSQLKKRMLNYISLMKKERKMTLNKIGIYGKKILKHRTVLMTHSNSSAVWQIIKSAHSKIDRIYVTRSEPLGEGVKFGKKIEQSGISVGVIYDSSAASYLPLCDVVIVGGDALTEEYFVNKVGTLNLALASNYFKIPFYVASDSLKIISKDVYKFPQQNKPPLFEKIPIDLVSGIITEEGIIKSPLEPSMNGNEKLE